MSRSPPALRRLAAAACLVVLTACGGPGSPDAGDAGGVDAGRLDAGRPDDGGVDAGRLDAGDAPWFEEVGTASGIVVNRVPRDGLVSMPDRFSGGVCVLDVDGRPPLDLFFAMRPSTASRSLLFVGRGALDYAEESTMRGLGDVGDALGCLAFDADGDADDDLLVTGFGELRLYRNDGGTFVRSTALPALTFDPLDILAGAAAGDVDGDGDVDVLVAGYLRALPTIGISMLQTAPGLPDVLLLSDGLGGFTVAPPALAPDLARLEPTLAVEILDLDGRPPDDIHVGNDFGQYYPDRALVHAMGEPLRDEAPARGLDYDASHDGVCTMGMATADLDGDGNPDHVSTNFQRQSTAIYFCDAAYDCVERGALTGAFDRSATFRWGVALVDVDLDGDLDLFESTGHLLLPGETTYIGPDYGLAQAQSLMLQDTDGLLVPVTPLPADGLAEQRIGRGLAAVDLDDDGRMDFVVASAMGPAAVLHGVRPTSGHWLRVVLHGRGQNRAGLGAHVRVHGPTHTEVRQHLLGGGAFGNQDPRLHFGLADASPVDVEVRWPSGAVTTLSGVATDGEVIVSE